MSQEDVLEWRLRSEMDHRVATVVGTELYKAGREDLDLISTALSAVWS